MALVNITAIPRPIFGWQSVYLAPDGAGGAGKAKQLTTDDVLGERFIDRFWVFVNKTPTCWLWTASKDKDGYGQIISMGSLCRIANGTQRREMPEARG